MPECTNVFRAYPEFRTNPCGPPKRVLSRYELPIDLQPENNSLSKEQQEEKKNLINRRILFRQQLRTYVRQYGFVSQVITYMDVELEKLYLFAKLLSKKLPYEPETLPLEVVEMVDMEKYRQREEQNGSITLEARDTTLEQPAGEGPGGGGEDVKDRLSTIVKDLNERYYFYFHESDRVVKAVRERLEQDIDLAATFDNQNTRNAVKRQKFQERVEDALLENANEYLSFLSKAEDDPAFNNFFVGQLFDWFTEQRADSSQRPSV